MESETVERPVTDCCRICGNGSGNGIFPATEMMLGLREQFDYLECGGCGALQIARVPADLARFYDPPYYSFAPPRSAGRLRRFLMRRLAGHVLGRPSLLGAALVRFHPAPPVIMGMAASGLGADTTILDVGTGAGQMLVSLHDYGFDRILGVDAFLPSEISRNGLRIVRGGLEDVAGEFDLIMFHHSFEHVIDPAGTLVAARARLAQGGWIVIATPVAGATWREYGADWVELDAPRHLHVHTHASIGILAAAADLTVARVVYDTSAFELWGSEQYRRGVPLADPRSHGMGGRGEVFTRSEMREFAARAAALNRNGDAGRASFWLTATSGTADRRP